MPTSHNGRIAILATDIPVTNFLIQRLQTYTSSRRVTLQVETPDEVLNNNFLHNTASPLGAVFIPGARSSQAFRDHLGQKGFQALRDYVQAGGSVIGICQGFYLLSSAIHYTDVHGVAKGSRDNLDLLPGLTVGDLRPHFNTLAQDSSYDGWHRTTVVSLAFQRHQKNEHKPVSCFYWGGPLYLPADSQNVQGVATYQDIALAGQSLAAAERQIGKGLALGMAPHLEVSSDMLLNADGLHLFDRDNGRYRRQMAAALAPDDERRSALFDSLVDYALSFPYGKSCTALSIQPKI